MAGFGDSVLHGVQHGTGVHHGLVGDSVQHGDQHSTGVQHGLVGQLVLLGEGLVLHGGGQLVLVGGGLVLPRNHREVGTPRKSGWISSGQ